MPALGDTKRCTFVGCDGTMSYTQPPSTTTVVGGDDGAAVPPPVPQPSVWQCDKDETHEEPDPTA